MSFDNSSGANIVCSHNSVCFIQLMTTSTGEWVWVKKKKRKIRIISREIYFFFFCVYKITAIYIWITVTVPLLDMSTPSQSGLSGLTSKTSCAVILHPIHPCFYPENLNFSVSATSSSPSCLLCLYTTTLWNTRVHSSSNGTASTFFRFALANLHTSPLQGNPSPLEVLLNLHRGGFCLTLSVGLSITIANRRGLRADPWFSATSTSSSHTVLYHSNLLHSPTLQTQTVPEFNISCFLK